MNIFLKVKHFIISRIRHYLEKESFKIGFWINRLNKNLDKYFTRVLEKNIKNKYLNKNNEERKNQIELLNEHLSLKYNIYRKYSFKLLNKIKIS